MRPDPKRPEPKKPESKGAIKAPHMLKFSFCCQDSPYFHLTQPERKKIEAAFVAELAAVFPPKVRQEWEELEFPLLLIGPGGQEILLEPDKIDEQREYLRLYFEHKLRELTPPGKPPPGFPMGEQRLSVADNPDDPCVMCISRNNEHICVRCAPIDLDGRSYNLTQDTRLGKVEAQVAVQLIWSQPLEAQPAK